MKIWINRAGQNLGTFTLEEVQRGLNQGQYVPTDLGWQEGMASWKPLAEFAGLQMPPPEVQPGSLTPIPPYSPDVPPPLGEATLATIEGVEDGPAWERRKELGLVQALFQTWKEVLFNPGVSFSRMKTSGGFASPFLFNLTMTLPYTVFTTLYQLLWTWAASAMAAGSMHEGSNTLSGISTGLPPLLNVGVMLVAFPITLGLTFVTAGITHLFLALFKGTSKSYEATYRVICYSTSAYIFAIVPCAGGFVLGIWWLVSAIIGLSKVHKTEAWRAAVALLLPLVVCIGLVIALYIVIIAIGVAALHHANT
jgi:hypothetical protein